LDRENLKLLRAFLQNSHDSNLSKRIILFSRDLIQKLPSSSFGSDSRRLVASGQVLQGAVGGLGTSTATCLLQRAAGRQGTAEGRGCGSTRRRHDQAVAAKHGWAAHGAS
jgi:hypothetical protein